MQTEQRFGLCELPDSRKSRCDPPSTNESDEDDFDYDALIERIHHKIMMKATNRQKPKACFFQLLRRRSRAEENSSEKNAGGKRDQILPWNIGGK